MPIANSQRKPRGPGSLHAAGLAVAILPIACAGSTSQGDVASKGGVPSVTQISTTDPTLRTELAAESDMHSRPIAAPPDSVWALLSDVYAALSLPVTVRDPDNRAIGATSHRPRRIEGKRLSLYLDCGEGITATPYADQYEVTLSLLTQVRSLPTGGSLLVSEVRATARARTTSGNAITCTSRRTLEERIADLAEQQLAAARAAGGA
jgi:hypothetical protein